MATATTTARIDLTELLTADQYESIFGISDRYESDLIEAVKRSNGGSVYQGSEDTYFPDPVFLTKDEVLFHAKFMRDEALKISDNVAPIEAVETEVWDATEEVDEEIVDQIWVAINA